MKALIDADLLLYRSGFACQSSLLYVYEVGNEEWGWITALKNKTEVKAWIALNPGKYFTEEVITVEPIQNYINIMKSTVKSIMFTTRATHHTLFLTGKDNYRYKVAKIQEYKGNRKDARKPELYDAAKTYLINHMGAEVMQTCEADDGMSMEQWGEWDKRDFMERENTPTVICTADKDLNMVPGYHYNWIKRDSYFVEEDEGMKFFYKQALTGDATDNIPGLFKLTGVRATKKLLNPIDTIRDYRDMKRYVMGVYENALSNEYTTEEDREYIKEYMVPEVMRLLWMSRRKEDDCFK